MYYTYEKESESNPYEAARPSSGIIELQGLKVDLHFTILIKSKSKWKMKPKNQSKSWFKPKWSNHIKSFSNNLKLPLGWTDSVLELSYRDKYFWATFFWLFFAFKGKSTQKINFDFSNYWQINQWFLDHNQNQSNKKKMISDQWVRSLRPWYLHDKLFHPSGMTILHSIQA